MIKLKFYNVDNSSDVFTLQIPKGYIHNFSSTVTQTSYGYNDRYTIFENYKSLQEQLNVPSYDDLSKAIKRTYQCTTVPNLILEITFVREETATTNTGIKTIIAVCRFRWGGTNTAYLDFGFQYPTLYQAAGASQINGSWCPIDIGYDDINEVMFVIGRQDFIISHIHMAETAVTGRYNNLIGVCPQLTKGDYSLISPNPQFEGKTIYNNTTFNNGDIGKHIYSSWFNHEKPSDNSLYSFLVKAGVKPTYPDGDDDDDYPDGDGDKDSDPVPPDPDFPISVAQTGFVSMYAPTLSQLRQLASFMWSTDFIDILAKLQQDPYEAIISLKAVKCGFDKGGTSNIILGNVDTKISCTEITRQYQQIDCGSINLNRFYGNFLDFNPYTSIKIYLPFIGYRDLDVDEVMGSTLHLYYNVDLLTGSCVALLHVNKEINGTNLDSVLYQYDGIMANEIPVTASNFTQVLSSIIRGAATTAAAIGVTAATGGAGAPAGGALLGSAAAGEASTAIGTTMMVNSAIDTVTSKISVQHGGGLSGSMGSLATKQPYVIIQRVIEKNPTNYAKLHGIPSNTYKKLSSLKGFTIMQDIQIQSAIGTVDETEQIKQLLLSGVVF